MAKQTPEEKAAKAAEKVEAAAAKKAAAQKLSNDGHIEGKDAWSVILQDEKYYAIPTCEVAPEDKRVETISTHDSYMGAVEELNNHQ